MKDTKHETHEEQVERVLKEMVASGELLMTVGEDGEVYFSMAAEEED